MPVFRWQETWNPLRDLERQVDRLLEGIQIPFPAIRFERQFPPVNVYELGDEYLLTAELPGTAAETLDLTVNQGVLTLKGSRPAPTGVNDDQFRRHERMWGKWERALTIPERVVEEKVSAQFNDGVLKIHLPRAAEVKPRQIQVLQTNGQTSEGAAGSDVPIKNQRATLPGDAPPRELTMVPPPQAPDVPSAVVSEPPAEQVLFTPPIDIYETTEGLVLIADLPGVSLSSLELQVQDNRLTLLGRVPRTAPAGAQLVHKEYDEGDFLRSFILSEEVDHDRITARLNTGVLEVVLPRAAKDPPRRIHVQSD